MKKLIALCCRSGRVACLMLLMMVAQACSFSGYKFNGSSLNYSIYKTISFSDFPIRAALVYPPLQQLFENKMKDMVSQNTRLRIVDTPNSDLRMEGEITGYSLSPQAVGEDAYASQTRLTVSVHIKYIDNKNPALSADQTFSVYRDFDSNTMFSDVQDDLCAQICDDLKDLIFNATLGNW